MRRTIPLLAAALLLASCSDEGSSVPVPASTGSIRIVNVTSRPIHQVHVSLATDPSWGDIRNASPVPPSGSFTVHRLAPGGWDVLAVSIGVDSPYFAYGYGDVVAGETLELTAGEAAFSGSLRVVNASGYPLTSLFVVPDDWPDWGDSQLPEPLGPGASILLYGLPSGGYGVRCDYPNGLSDEAAATVAPFAVTQVTCY